MSINRSLLVTLQQCIKSQCVNKTSKFGLRAFASSASAMKSSRPSAQSAASSKSPATELLRTLKSEIEAQKEMIQEQAEELDPKLILKSYESFLKENNWTLEHAENSTLVTLKRRDEGLQADVAIKFDLVQVFNELYENEEEFDDQEEHEEHEHEQDDVTKNEMEEIDEDVQFVTLPFSVEIKRDSIPEKSLIFDCVLEGDESENEIILENASIIPTDSTKSSSVYLSPSYSQLDESLQESFEEFVKNLVESEELMGFVKNYSVASEAKMYQAWLKDVSTILKN